MNLGLISDLHYDTYETITKADFYENIHQLVTELALDYLVIGGDISNNYATTITFVEDLQTIINIPVYFIPGNHDYWEKDIAVKDTQAIYQQFVKHPQCLMESPILLNDHYALVGHTAWYNYSVHADRFTEAELEKGVYGERTWQDKRNTDWGVSDKNLSRQFADLVETDLNRVGDREVVLVTHMVTVPEFTVPMPHESFDYFNAFIATDDFDTIYQQYPIKYSSMGHIHYRGSFTREGITYICNCLGYEKEWRSPNFKEELRNSLYVIDLA
ncbi:metallophosphoesterase [Fundicoccus culcitae]|uniref:Metallophosphoesterase n=1 Tax=Fundicoccus culcitae TaxID=2969821 RepID=A0ABY5P2Q8_9LACT|nr:metallophosphoesterase [Fundicoccus culcitae]UUX33011.1 metallophosphoesterase [Fundicoccus culcitae]